MTDTHLQVVEYCLNRLDELVFMAGPKPMLTEFGIHQILESCDTYLQQLKLSSVARKKMHPYKFITVQNIRLSIIDPPSENYVLSCLSDFSWYKLFSATYAMFINITCVQFQACQFRNVISSFFLFPRFISFFISMARAFISFQDKINLSHS